MTTRVNTLSPPPLCPLLYSFPPGVSLFIPCITPFASASSIATTVAVEGSHADEESADNSRRQPLLRQQHDAIPHPGEQNTSIAPPIRSAAAAMASVSRLRLRLMRSAQSLHGRGLQPAQIAFGDTPEDAARVAGRIAHQALQFARKLAGLFLYPLREKCCAVSREISSRNDSM